MIEQAHLALAEAFFGLPESDGYVVGGGVAALAHGVVERPTEDIDLFIDRRHVKARPLEAARALSVEAGARGWAVDWIREFPDHARLLVATDAGPLLVDLVLETVDQKPVVTVVGPTVSERDAAVGKLVALFDRAEARDFVDVFEFCRRYDRMLLIRLAGLRDTGLDGSHLAERCRRMTEHLTAADLPAGYQERFEEIREFYVEWRQTLLA